GADELVADGDLDRVADDGDLYLAAPVLVADAVAGGGEAHVAGGVDLAGDRRRRGRRPRRTRFAGAVQSGVLLVDRVAAAWGATSPPRCHSCTSPPSHTICTC